MEQQRLTYEQTMVWSAEQYRDVLGTLAANGLQGQFIQTGGMCAAIEVLLDGGSYLLFTDFDDTLSWDRRDHIGYCWLYEHEDDRTVDGPLRWLIDEDGSHANAVKLARRVLGGETADDPIPLQNPET